MADGPPRTVGDLRRKAIVTDAEITAATEAYLDNPLIAAFKFASGHVLDINKAVKEQQPAKAALSGIISDSYRRTMVRIAVILATPDSGQ